MNYKQLTFAREFRGYNQSDLADSIDGLSQSNLSKFEKGFGVLSEGIQKKIVEFLNFPTEFFDKKISNKIDNANYRKRSTTKKSLITEFESRCKLIGYIIDQLSQDLEWPEFDISPLNVEDGFSPVKCAQYTRRFLRISPDLPIKDIFTVLEKHGIIIYELNAVEKFDGVSFISDLGFPVIIINKNFSNDRKRFTIAHELGHLVMHNENNFPVSEYRDKEKEANNFASEFLMPEESIKNSLRNLKINELGELKSYWLTSMSSIIRRAKDLKCIDESRYKYFLIELSRMGYTRNEPIRVPIDKPELLEKARQLMNNELNYNEREFINFLALPNDVVDELLPRFEEKIKIISFG
ncbi:XRE family transcriptional regulator [Sphingobacterium sp.]|uniref:helix-turn-helix domain-containing protein n=1 Tax=Sphingobacterium sp. TaxID=341027 RepID=UPI0031D1E404